jgi:hypothetical protein
MADLLPATRALLLELLDGLDEADSHLPEVRVSGRGRSGARVWLRGTPSRELEGRRPTALFDELRAAGLLRKLRSEQSGDYYAFTPAAFRLRDEATRPPAPPAAGKQRTSQPPPELAAAASMREVLGELAGAADASLRALIDASEVSVFRNNPGSGFVYFPKHPVTWKPLDRSQIPLLGAAREATERWTRAARRALALAAPEHLDAFDEHSDVLMEVCVRPAPAPAPAATPAEIQAKTEGAIAAQLALIDDLPGAVEEPRLLLVPDTNALLADPAVEEWRLGSDAATIVVAQQVVVELDGLKVTGNDSVKAKANQLIRRFKEYSRRGDTFTGVPLAGKLRFRELPGTPDMALLGSDLSASHADDRILATTLGLAARHLTSRVVLITRDRNLSNKARLLSITAVDIDDV